MSAGGKGRRAVDSCRDEFTLVVEGGKPKMQCNHCGVAITNHTVTLKNHLARKHGGGEAAMAAAAAAAAAVGGGSGGAKAGVATGGGAATLAVQEAAAAAVGREEETEDDDEEEGDAAEEEKTSADGKQSGGGGTAAVSVVAQEQPSTAAGKKDHKKRMQRNSIDNGSHSNGEKEREEVDKQQHQQNETGAKVGADKKRRLADATEGVDASASREEQAEVLPPPPLIDHEEFADMNREMHEYDEMREQIIKRSREILKSSKQAIFALHRNDRNGAADLITKAEAVIPELFELAKDKPTLRDGSLSAALEEYVEAKSFSYYLAHHRLLPLRDLPNVQKSEYIGGIIDLTGELMRYAVVKATARDVAEVERCRSMVEAISGELIQFDFRNGPLRKKYDSVKYNLRKLENTLYELSLITNSGLTIRSEALRDEPSADVEEV